MIQNDGIYIYKTITVLDITDHCAFYLKQHSREWILSPSLSGTCSILSSRQSCSLCADTSMVYEVRMMDNVQNCDSYVNVLLSQIYRSYLL
jgi:hypothetical protein